MIKIVYAFAVFVLLSLSSHAHAEDYFVISDEKYSIFEGLSGPIYFNEYNSISTISNMDNDSLNHKKSKESSLRRFEILFFISLPFTLITSYTGVSLYYVLNGVSADLAKYRAPQFAMIGASSILMSTAIAFHGVYFQCQVSQQNNELAAMTSRNSGQGFFSQIKIIKKI